MMNAARLGLPITLLAASLPGFLGQASAQSVDLVAESSPKRVRPANAVVAVVDTGINPYHEVFRDGSARAHKHPSGYIRGFPKGAAALRLSLNEKDYWTAVRKDCKRVWSKVEPGKLYWFPGTKIVGAISFSPESAIDCSVPEPRGAVVLDGAGHGTMTASRATALGYGACSECRVVAVQFPGTASISLQAETDPSIEAIRWAADNATWIDAQSNSWGPVVPAWEPTGAAGLFTANPELVKAVEEVSSAHLAFWASGNGALFRLGAVGHPTTLAAHFAPSAIMVGGHDSGYVNTWPGFPAHVVSDSCASWAAYHDKIDESAETVGSGTSAATPFAAGGATRVLLEARRILKAMDTGIHNGVVARGQPGTVKEGPLKDGKFTVEEWRDVVFKTATARPAGQAEDGPPCVPGPYGPTPVKWTDVPDDYPEYLHIGYGAVDDAAFDLALKVLKGKTPLPDRSDTDEFFAIDRQVRETTYPVFSGP